jgi:hypothetical protein
VKKPKAKRIAYDKLKVQSPFQPNWDVFFKATEDNESRSEDAMLIEEEGGDTEDDGVGIDTNPTDTNATKTLCVLRGASYMEPFPFSGFSTEREFIPVAVPTLIRVALSFPRRGELAPCSMVRRVDNPSVVRRLTCC